MLTRRQAMLTAPAGVLVVGAAAAAYVGLGHKARSASAIGGPFTLVDGDGRTVTERSLLGKWALVYFGYTHCPDACPTALQDMANAVDLLGPAKENVRIVFITVDPARDTPAVMKDYVSNFGAPILGLTGSAEQVARAARAYRVYYAEHKTADGYDMDHSSVIYVMDKDGEFVANFTHQSAPEQIADKLKALMG